MPRILTIPLCRKCLFQTSTNIQLASRWGERFRLGQYPADFESCDWSCGVRGRHPRYFQYVKHGACHWLVNFNLTLAQLVEPKKEWRIVTSLIHSSVWDGEHTLFDLNGLALFNGDAPECFVLAALAPGSRELALGELDEAGLPRMTYAREIVGLRLKPLYHTGRTNICPKAQTKTEARRLNSRKRRIERRAWSSTIAERSRMDLPRFGGEVRYWVKVSDLRIASSSLSIQFLGSAPAEPVPSSRPCAGSAGARRGCQARADCAPARACLDRGEHGGMIGLAGRDRTASAP